MGSVKVAQTTRESTKIITKEVKVDRDTLRREEKRHDEKESPRGKDNESDKSDKSNRSAKNHGSDSSSKKAHSDKDSDKGNTTPREDKPFTKSEPIAIASPSLEQPKRRQHIPNKSELPVRPKPSAAAAKRRREFDTATALTLFGDMEKVLEAPPSENAEMNDLKALLGDADIKLNL